jgi:hypothetical protein
VRVAVGAQTPYDEVGANHFQAVIAVAQNNVGLLVCLTDEENGCS